MPNPCVADKDKICPIDSADSAKKVYKKGATQSLPGLDQLKDNCFE